MERVKLNVHSLHAPSVVLGAILGGATGSVVCYLLVRNKLRARADAEVASVKHHYQARAAMAKDGADDAGYLTYRAGILRAAELGYGDPSGNTDGYVDVTQLVEDELERGLRDGDQPDPGADSVWPGTAEGIREQFEGGHELVGSGLRVSPEADRVASDEDSSDEVRGDSEGDRGMAAGSEAVPGPGARSAFLNRDGIDSVLVWPPVDRDESRPYRIDNDEFEDESYEHYTKISLTYYAGDGVLVDDKDDPIRVFAQITGPIKLEDFGGVSLDPHILYVRNSRMECDFEVLLKQTSYVDAILNYGTAKTQKGSGHG